VKSKKNPLSNDQTKVFEEREREYNILLRERTMFFLKGLA
jgi:hypothetical protein